MKTGAKKDKATKALVPKLRFPEFRGAEGWNERPLAELMSESRLPGSKGNVAKKITVKLWGNGVFEKNDSIQGSINTQYFRRKAGQFIYSKLDFLNQAFGIIPPSLDNFESTVDLPCFDFADELNPVFLLEYVKRRDFYERLGETADGSRKARRIHAETFLSFPIALPIPAEQQKIANCLSSLDELIAAQGRKVESLKTHKKGLMQQLFPREGETQPRLRFPEFQNALEWKEVVLGDIAEIKLGKMLDKQKHTTGHFLPYLNNLSVRWNEVNTTDLPKMYFNDRELDRFGLKAGDVVVCEGGEPGRAAVWDGRLPDIKFQKAIHRVRFKVPFEPKILVLHLENIAGTTAFDMLFTGGGIKHLTGETFSRLKTPLIPRAEQQRIADCLSSLDTLITAATQTLDTLKTHKQGLMQQLFPAPEEVEA